MNNREKERKTDRQTDRQTNRKPLSLSICIGVCAVCNRYEISNHRKSYDWREWNRIG